MCFGEATTPNEFYCPSKMNALLSTTYFGPIQWYQKLYRADEVWIEQHESFQKQTYRNRCVIATTQGTQVLTVPVRVKSSSLINNVRISDHGNWRHLHWNALKSAYGDSPFFMYYEDDLRPFFERRWDYLFDFNEAIREKICELLDIHPNVHYTNAYLPSHVGEGTGAGSVISDFRNTINPLSTIHYPPSTIHHPLTNDPSSGYRRPSDDLSGRAGHPKPSPVSKARQRPSRTDGRQAILTA